MRKLPGVSRFDANVTTTENALATALLIKPEISMHIVNLFEGQFTSFTSYLSRKGLTKKGVIGQVDKDFRVVGNRRFEWAVEGYPIRMGKIQTAVTGSTIGQNQAVVELVLDTNYFSPNDVLELQDNRTLVHVLGMPTETTDGNFKYQVKLVTDIPSAFIPASLLVAGAEVGFSYTMFPEMSETGYEKNSYPEWFTETMTIQRMQYSISGTAGNSEVCWVLHNGQKLWYYRQEEQMMYRWAMARENQLLFGRSTSDANGNVTLKDLQNREIVGGNGLLAQGDASLKFQYNVLSTKVIDNVLQNLQLMSNGGETEVMLIGGQQLVWNFQELIAKKFQQTGGEKLIDGSGSEKGYNGNFRFYNVGGVKLTVAWSQAFDAQFKPSAKDAYGNRTASSRGMFISLGNTVGGSGANVELVALGAGGNDRRFVKREINGMFSVGASGTNGRASVSSTSMDGTQVQVLSETGIKLSNPFAVAELYV